MQMFYFSSLFCVYGDYKTQNRKNFENLTAKLQNSNQNSTFPGLA